MPYRSMRVEYGKLITKLGETDDRIVLLEGDLQDSTQSVQFQKVFPERYFEIGVAEQNMVGIAAGLALEGKVPFVHSFAAFISMRACEQVRTSVAYPNLNVKFLASHAGFSAGSAGPTHHAIEDLAIMRAIPNMTVLAPCDVREMRQAVTAAVEHVGPVYIRIPAMDTVDVYEENSTFNLGQATLLRNGRDLTIISTGVMASEAMEAAKILDAEHKISARVLQFATVKPIDRQAIIQAAEETRLLVTVEEHNLIGGLGGAVSQVVAGLNYGKVVSLGIDDHFVGIGSWSFLLNEEKISSKYIVQNVLHNLAS